MPNIIATYHGGIHAGIEAALCDNGNLYVRFQDRDPRYGWKYGRWMFSGNIGNKKPLTIECGFSTLRDDGTPHKYRLPENAPLSKWVVSPDCCDIERPSYYD
jgi:hypothetical protein